MELKHTPDIHVPVSTLSVFTIKRLKGASAARTRGVLMMKILNINF